MHKEPGPNSLDEEEAYSKSNQWSKQYQRQRQCIQRRLTQSRICRWLNDVPSDDRYQEYEAKIRDPDPPFFLLEIEQVQFSYDDTHKENPYRHINEANYPVNQTTHLIFSQPTWKLWGPEIRLRNWVVPSRINRVHVRWQPKGRANVVKAVRVAIGIVYRIAFGRSRIIRNL